MHALGDVVDPELGMSIVALGLVYDVRIAGGAVDVTMTLTAPGCPLHDLMTDWVRGALARVPGVEQVRVELTFEPPWTPDRLPSEGRSPRRPPGRPATGGAVPR